MGTECQIDTRLVAWWASRVETARISLKHMRRLRLAPRGACAGHNRALRVAQAVPGGEAHQAKMGDVHAEHALQGLMDPTVSWGRLRAGSACG